MLMLIGFDCLGGSENVRKAPLNVGGETVFEAVGVGPWQEAINRSRRGGFVGCRPKLLSEGGGKRGGMAKRERQEGRCCG